MSDAMAVLHKLQTGLDVNVKFTGVRVFEYTPECIVFDLLDIPLYHGWLVDPQVRWILLIITAVSLHLPESNLLSCLNSLQVLKHSACLLSEVAFTVFCLLLPCHMQ